MQENTNTQQIQTPTQPIQAPVASDAKPNTPKVYGFLVMLLSVLLLVAVGAAGFFAYQTQNLVKQLTNLQNATPIPTDIPQETATPVSSGSPAPLDETTADWDTYQNTDYSFEVKYPTNYTIEDDNYGWPKAVLLLYSGGQSYDLIIEVWDTKAEYEQKYNAATLQSITVYEKDGKFITLFNQNNEAMVDQIIATFQFI